MCLFVCFSMVALRMHDPSFDPVALGYDVSRICCALSCRCTLRIMGLSKVLGALIGVISRYKHQLVTLHYNP